MALWACNGWRRLPQTGRLCHHCTCHLCACPDCACPPPCPARFLPRLALPCSAVWAYDDVALAATPFSRECHGGALIVRSLHDMPAALAELEHVRSQTGACCCVFVAAVRQLTRTPFAMSICWPHMLPRISESSIALQPTCSQSLHFLNSLPAPPLPCPCPCRHVWAERWHPARGADW